MEWQIKYEPMTRQLPWSVYKTFETESIYECGFVSEEEARHWADKKEKQQAAPQGDKPSKVDESSIESFPASDPPAWTKSTAKTDQEHLKNISKSH